LHFFKFRLRRVDSGRWLLFRFGRVFSCIVFWKDGVIDDRLVDIVAVLLGGQIEFDIAAGDDFHRVSHGEMHFHVSGPVDGRRDGRQPATSSVTGHAGSVAEAGKPVADGLVAGQGSIPPLPKASRWNGRRLTRPARVQIVGVSLLEAA